MREPASPLPSLPSFLGRMLAWAYAAAIERRNRAFDARKGVIEIDRPVISVGNLSVGGTGKTPMVARLVRVLLEAQHRPAIAMRGYRARQGMSDEAADYADQFPGVPVVAQANRLEGLLALFHEPRGAEIDCVVLDDGFQHRRLARQCDIVLLDASRSVFRDQILPLGWLRESTPALRRATAIVLTHAERVAPRDVQAMVQQVRAVAPGAILAVSSHAWTSLRVTDRRGERTEPISMLHGRRCLVACAIGAPRQFVEACRAACGVPPVEFILRDHDPFRPATIARLIETAEREGVWAIVTTSKDWTKLARVRPEAWPCPVVRPTLELAFSSGWEELRRHVLETADRRTSDEDEQAGLQGRD